MLVEFSVAALPVFDLSKLLALVFSSSLVMKVLALLQIAVVLLEKLAVVLVSVLHSLLVFLAGSEVVLLFLFLELPVAGPQLVFVVDQLLLGQVELRPLLLFLMFLIIKRLLSSF